MKANFHSALLILSVTICSCTSKQEVKPENGRLLGAGFGIGGATLIVKDLDSTRNYFTKVLGFKMPEKFQKGSYDGTISASVSFAEGSSMELLSLKDTGLVAIKHSFITSLLKRYNGVRVYSVYTSSADTTLK